MLAMYPHTGPESGLPGRPASAAPEGAWTWECGETTCDGCGQRLAARSARIVSHGPVAPDGTCGERPRVFHRLSCVQKHLDARTIALGLRDL